MVLSVSYLAVGQVRYFGHDLDEATRCQWGPSKLPMGLAKQKTNEENAISMSVHGYECAYCVYSGLLALEHTGRAFYSAYASLDGFQDNPSWELIGELWWDLFPQVAGHPFENAMVTLVGVQPTIRSVFYYSDGFLYASSIHSERYIIKRRTCRWVKTGIGYFSDVYHWWRIPFRTFSDGVTIADDEAITITSSSEIADGDS